jgi:uncharacterized membrane protein (DUF373 family)
MARRQKHMLEKLAYDLKDDVFLKRLNQVESIVAKVLSLTMTVVILVLMIDLGIVLYTSIFSSDSAGFLKTTLIDIFGLFLSVLIALEILENVTAYIRKHVIHVELVIATALTAVGRKLIILDIDKVEGLSLVGLAMALFALSISYLIVRTVHH